MSATGPQRVEIGNQVHRVDWLCTSEGGQRVLAACHAGDRRARCRCIPEGVEMYVARRGTHYYLARMPGSGPQHAASCASMAAQDLFSGIGCYLPEVLDESPTGEITVRLDPGAPRGRAGLSAMSLDGLLDLLIEGAGLNVRKANDGRRGWRLVREALAGAADALRLHGVGALSERLLLPLPFSKDTHATEWPTQQAFLSVADDLRLVCAPLRDIVKSPYGWMLRLKHLPDARFWVATAVGEALAQREGRHDPLAQPPAEALCLFQVRRGRNEGSFNVRAPAIRRTDGDFLPCATDAQQEAAWRLVDAGVAFMHPLRFDLDWGVALADHALADADPPQPVGSSQ